MFIIIVTIIIIFIIIDISTANTAGQYKRLLTLIPHVFVTTAVLCDNNHQYPSYILSKSIMTEKGVSFSHSQQFLR